MYIITQEGEIINSKFVVKFSHSLQGVISNQLPKEDEVALITAYYSGSSKNSDDLGAYIGVQKADEVLQALLHALQDGTDTFHMPLPL